MMRFQSRFGYFIYDCENRMYYVLKAIYTQSKYKPFHLFLLIFFLH